MASIEYCDHTIVAPMADARQKATLRKIEIDKQKNLGETRSELESLRADYSKVQQQCSALKARNKTLTSNVKSLKEEITSLTEKQAKNDKAKLMVMLRAKSSNSDNYFSQDECDMLQDVEREKQRLSQDNQILRAQLDKCLTELQAIKTAQHQVKYSHPMKISPLPQVASQGSQKGQRLSCQIERKAISAGQPLGSLHMHSGGDESSIMIQVSQIEQERLLELTSSLQRRLAATTDKFNRLNIEMKTLRQQNARLEKIVGRSRKATTDNANNVSDHEKVEELETQLAIQVDVNAVLKDTLELTRHEK